MTDAISRASGFDLRLRVHRSARMAAFLLRVGLGVATAPPAAILSSRALLIWRQRSDLQAVFDLRHRSGRTGLFWWYLLQAYVELGLETDEEEAELGSNVNLALPRLVQHGFVPITWLMREASRRSGRRFAPLRSHEGQDQILAWFFARGLTDKRLDAFLTEEQADGLRASSAERPGVPRILHFIWQTDEKIRASFDGEDDPAFFRWCRCAGARDYPILAHPRVALVPPWRPVNRVAGRFGVNVIGHAFHRSGLSEDVRAAVRALDAAQIPFSIYDAGPNAGVADEDLALANRASKDLPFDVNLFCFTGESTVTTVLANPELKRDRRYSIGMWPWELPEWPEFWRHAYHYVDEIWAASRFTYDSYCRSASVPVRHMPMVVTVTPAEGAGRADFGLPQDRFLFAFAFDGLSSIARKNPAACVAAFQAAFPDRSQPVGLVIKGLRAVGAEAWERLLVNIADDTRIVTITESLPRGRLLDLYRSIDCFVSLHRSEGFGRNIAEAMLLEKPVIVSAHSGNMDFTDHATAALVPVQLTTVAEGAYPFGGGQMWAEADIAAAAERMRRVIEDRAWRTSLAQAGKARVEQLYAPAEVGRRWGEVLNGLCQ